VLAEAGVCRVTEVVSRWSTCNFASTKNLLRAWEGYLRQDTNVWVELGPVMWVGGGVARGSRALIEASSTRLDAMTFLLYSSNPCALAINVSFVERGWQNGESMYVACKGASSVCKCIIPMQLLHDFGQYFTFGLVSRALRSTLRMSSDVLPIFSDPKPSSYGQQ
jgi:hypothetical protein